MCRPFLLVLLLGGLLCRGGGYDDGRSHASCPLIKSHVRAPGIKTNVHVLILLLLGGGGGDADGGPVVRGGREL